MCDNLRFVFMNMNWEGERIQSVLFRKSDPATFGFGIGFGKTLEKIHLSLPSVSNFPKQSEE